MIVELYIILFGIIAVVIYFARNLFIGVSNDQKLIDKAAAQREFTEKFIALELEKKVEKRLSDFRNRDSIFEELDAELTEIAGETYERDFRFDPSIIRKCGYISKDQYNNYWTKQLLLSKQGKFTADRHLFLGFGEKAYTSLKICQIIQRNIRQFDPSFTLCKESSYRTGHMPINSPYGRYVIPVCDFSSPFPNADINDYLI